jgi:hypothetical protein
MSQTNEFAKANNPDFVYFDLQTTNTYNNEIGKAPQLQFLESRDSPIVANSGDYYMSVTRFSVDTYNLPVLVVEPDITGNDPFEPTKSIHKVAIITEGANLKLASSVVGVDELITNKTASAIGTDFGLSVAMSDDGEVVVIGEPQADYVRRSRNASNPGGVYHKRGVVHIGIRNPTGTYDYTTLPFTEDTPNYRFGTSVAISGDGKIIVVGTGGEMTVAQTTPVVIPSVPVAEGSWVYNRITGSLLEIEKHLAGTKPSKTIVRTNRDGSVIAIGYPDMTTSSVAYGGFAIFSHNISEVTTTVKQSSYPTSGSTRYLGTAMAFNGLGDIFAITSAISDTTGGITIYSSLTTSWSSMSSASLSTSFGRFGASLDFNHTGTLLAVGAPLENATGRVRLVSYDKSTPTTTLTATTIINPANNYTGSIGFGTSVALSYDGSTIHIGAPFYDTSKGLVQTFLYESNDWVYKAERIGVGGINQKFGFSVADGGDGALYIVGSPSGTSGSVGAGHAAVRKLSFPAYTPLPSALVNTASIANVGWTPTNSTISPPTASELTGNNTAQFEYYWCNSYNNFIDKVNVAIKEAYVANFNKLWTDWLSTIALASTTDTEFIQAEFINIVARCFSTPPYLEWNSTLDATLYLNTLFSSIGNYYAPARTFTHAGQTQTSPAGIPQPLHLKVALNASLYALFNSFPATETIIEGEKFFIINVPKQVALLRDNATIPLRALPLIPDYPFLYNYYSATGAFTLPFPNGSSTTPYSLQEYFIMLKQEMSTIDTWCPISSIVFTSNTLPIVITQYSSTNTSGTQPSSGAVGSDFALVITDLITNQQGFRPNVVYNPSAEYRRIDMTGNQGIRNIDINVFWRSKTGLLIPFVLGSGSSASIKLLFEKKDKAQKQKA